MEKSFKFYVGVFKIVLFKKKVSMKTTCDCQYFWRQKSDKNSSILANFMWLGKCSENDGKLIWTKLQWTPKNVKLWRTS